MLPMDQSIRSYRTTRSFGWRTLHSTATSSFSAVRPGSRERPFTAALARPDWALFRERPVSHRGPVVPEEPEPVLSEGLKDLLGRAEAEGLKVFAPAPKPTFVDTALKVQAPHGRCTGMVQRAEELKRLDFSLTGDYFARPKWSLASVVRHPDVRLTNSVRELQEQQEKAWLDCSIKCPSRFTTF